MLQKAVVNGGGFLEYDLTPHQELTQWRVDLLTALGVQLMELKVPMRDVKIFYDVAEDYHRMTFMSGDKFVNVRFYKVYAVEVDGRDFWIGVLRSSVYALAKAMKEELAVGLTLNKEVKNWKVSLNIRTNINLTAPAIIEKLATFLEDFPPEMRDELHLAIPSGKVEQV